MIKDRDLESIDEILTKIKNSINDENNENEEDIIELTETLDSQQESIAGSLIANHDLELINNYIQAFTANIEKLRGKNFCLSEEEMKELFRETLRPYLRSWLHNNISQIVRDVLEKEIKEVMKKIVKKH